MKKPGIQVSPYKLVGTSQVQLPSTKTVSFTFAGQQLTGVEGMPVALALGLAGIINLANPHSTQARGLYCGIGHCYECRVVVDGVPHLRACLVPLKEGMAIDPDAPEVSAANEIESL